MICEGEGKDVLMLHGYMSCKESFYYQIKHLSGSFRVIVPDIIGFGASSPLDKPYCMEDYRVWLEDFCSAYGLVSPFIIAHSFGARLAFKYLAARRGGAEKLIVTGGAGIVKERSRRYIRRVKAYRRVRKIFPRFAERHFGSEEYRALPPVMRESYKAVVNEDLRRDAAEIDVPTLLVYGRDDRVTPADEEGRIFGEVIRGSRLVVCEGGHFCFCEHPAFFNKLTDDFFGK